MDITLSKKEAKYRTKFIQENHYDKAEQRIFDDAKAELGITYKELYKAYRRGEEFLFMLTICFSRVAKAVRNAGISAAQLAESISAITNAIAEEVVSDGT